MPSSESSPPQFSFWVTVAFTLNYIVGSGFLTLPWGFRQTGVGLGVAVLVIFAFFSILATNFLLEVEDRGQQYEKFLLGSRNIEMTGSISRNGYLAIEENNSSHSDTPLTEDDDEEENSSVEFSEADGSNKYAKLQGPFHERKLEITELCDIFLGPFGKHVYTAIVSIYMYGTLWAYATVFANSFAAHLNIGTYSYQFYLLVFGCIVGPVSLMEFSEQVFVQVSLSVFRVVMMFAMIATVLSAHFSGLHQFGEDHGSHWDEEIERVDFSSLHFLMPIAAYAYIFHHSVPSLAHPVADKSSLVKLFATALVLSMVFYVAVGAVVSLYFGVETLPSSNLNWVSYVGIMKAGGEVPYYARVLAFFIVLFPAIDVASAYPLNAYTLGNNIMSAYYGREMYKHDKIRWKLNLFRLIAAVPPIFAALFESRLEFITDYTGLTAFGLAFIIPPLLARYSSMKLHDIGLSPQTVHSNSLTAPFFQAVLGVSGIVLFFYVAGCLLAGSPK